MSLQARIFVVLIGLVVLLFVINLVRIRRLKEEFALLWLFVATSLVISPLIADWIEQAAYAVGVDYPPALIFLVTIVLFLFIFFQFSMNISKFSDQIKVLTQEIAILTCRIERLEQLESRSSVGSEQSSVDGEEENG